MGPTTTTRVVFAAVLLTLFVTGADAQQLAGSFEHSGCSSSQGRR